MAGAASNQPCLTVLGGPMSGTVFVIEDAVDNILIGSDSSCKFCIPLPGVSPIHARIWLDAGGTIVYDTHSPRGLYVNDDRVNGQAPLKNGDILWLGTPGEEDVVMIQCRLPRPAEAQPDAPEPKLDVAEPEPEEAGIVMAAEPAAAPPAPAESEFYVEVPSELEERAPAAPPPEPPPAEQATIIASVLPEEIEPPSPAFVEPPMEPPVAPTTVLAGPPDGIEDLPPTLLTPPPPVPSPALEFEDETIETPAPAAPPPAPKVAEPETIAVPPPRPAEPAPAPAPRPPAPKLEPKPARPAAPVRPTPAARPAAPRSAPAPAPTPAPTPVPRAEKAAGGSAARSLGIAAAVLAVLVVGGFLVWRFMRPTRTAVATPAPVPSSTTLRAAPISTQQPETQPAVVPTAVPPPVEEAVTIVTSPTPRAASPSPSPAKASPSAKPPASPAAVATPAGPSPEELRAQQVASQVASLLGQADAAAGSRPDEALRLYDEALKLDPQNARASAGKAATQGAAAASRKRFAAGRTQVQSGKAKGGDLSGFDSADVQVADAPGRIDFEVSPASVKPGDSYAARILFVNESKKAIKVKSLSVSTLTNGQRAGGPSAPKAREIAPGQRTLVGEVAGVWKDGTSAWSLDVVMVSERNDTYRNQVTWR
jgi:hypothetical protein